MSSPVVKLIRAGKASCDLQGSDDGEGGTCYPFTVSVERVASVETTIVKVPQKQDPRARLLIFVFRKRVGILCSLQMSSLRTAIRRATP